METGQAHSLQKTRTRPLSAMTSCFPVQTQTTRHRSELLMSSPQEVSYHGNRRPTHPARDEQNNSVSGFLPRAHLSVFLEEHALRGLQPEYWRQNSESLGVVGRFRM